MKRKRSFPIFKLILNVTIIAWSLLFCGCSFVRNCLIRNIPNNTASKYCFFSFADINNAEAAHITKPTVILLKPHESKEIGRKDESNIIQNSVNDFKELRGDLKKTYFVKKISLPEADLKMDSLSIMGDPMSPLFTTKSVKQPVRTLHVSNCIFDTYLYNHFGYSKYINIHNCQFSNAKGIAPGSGYGLIIGHTQRGLIENCVFFNNQRHSLYAGSCNNLLIDGNIFYQHAKGFGTGGFLAALNISRGSKNIAVFNNKFIECERLALNITTGKYKDRPTLIENIDIHDNLFYKTVGKDLKLGQTQTATDEINIRNVNIHNNTFINEEANCASITVFNGVNLIIDNNIFSKNKNNVIVIDNTNDKLKSITISNNTFKGNYKNAIYIKEKALNGSCKIIIKGNKFNGNGIHIGFEKKSYKNPNIHIF